MVIIAGLRYGESYANSKPIKNLNVDTIKENVNYAEKIKTFFEQETNIFLREKCGTFPYVRHWILEEDENARVICMDYGNHQYFLYGWLLKDSLLKKMVG